MNNSLQIVLWCQDSTDLRDKVELKNTRVHYKILIPIIVLLAVAAEHLLTVEMVEEEEEHLCLVPAAAGHLYWALVLKEKMNIDNSIECQRSMISKLTNVDDFPWGNVYVWWKLTIFKYYKKLPARIIMPSLYILMRIYLALQHRAAYRI